MGAATGDNTTTGQIASTPDLRLEILSATAACLSGVAGSVNNNFKLLGYCLAVANGILLVIVAVMRINAGLSNKKHKLPLVLVVASVCAVTLFLAGWSLAHPAIAPSARSSPPSPAKQEEPAKGSVNYNSSTSGKNSPVINGDNNSYTAGQTDDQPKKKRRP